jgi:hypothetical protein
MASDAQSVRAQYREIPMTRPLRLLPWLLIWGPIVGFALPAVAQTSAPPAAGPSKQCVTAKKRLDAEQRSLASAIESLARDRKGRESCSSKSMCTRYDTAISATEKRQARHETRVTRFKDEAEKACAAA